MPAPQGEKFFGLYRGIVLDNKDPKNQGRLKVAVPGVYGNDLSTGQPLESTWALPKFPMAGMNWGVEMIPPVTDNDGKPVMVWVEFEMGDQKKPVWSGCFIKPDYLFDPMKKIYPDKSVPYGGYCIVTPRQNRFYIDDNDKDGVMELVDRLGQYLRISNKTEKQFIELKDKFGNTITMDENGITIKDKFGNTIVMGAGGISENAAVGEHHSYGPIVDHN